MPGHRNERLTSLLTQEITLLLQNEIKDPRIDGVNSVTGVKLAKDIKSAIVFISSLCEKEKLPQVIEGLNSSAHYIRKRLGKILTLKYIPRIVFKLDDSIEKGTDLYFKLKNMEKEERELGWYDDEHDGKEEE
jgi:ribosome-binding factor A